MRVAYLDCIGGISGDMALGALLDAGVDVDQLLEGLRTLDLPPWELQTGRTRKSGIAAATVEVVVRGEAAGAAPLVHVPPADAPLEHPPHSHDHTHSHTHGHGHDHSHDQPSDHTSQTSHTPTPQHPNTPTPQHPHTSTFNDVAALIRASGLPGPVKEQAEAVYRRLAAAEAAVHGTTLERVHFHEVGAVDSIVDVVGSVYGLHLLGVERVLCSPLPTGKGFVRCAHGLMPIPPPATLELLKGCPLRQVDVEGELVTPTGAALAGALAESFGPLPGFTVREVGYGAGKKDFPFPNLLRVVIGDDQTIPSEATAVTLVEANIDDQSPQLYEAVMAALFGAGALDVWLTPVFMKKNRPAQTVSVLCEPEDVEVITGVLFAESTTLGVRYTDWKRICLQREWVEVETPYGRVRVKVGRQNGELRTATPEYEDCRLRAGEAHVPVKLVQAAAAAAAWQLLTSDRTA
jgi:pyridinium-3,5-bisthiocarboxylic acid mononucleotide nickel chelatase